MFAHVEVGVKSGAGRDTERKSKREGERERQRESEKGSKIVIVGIKLSLGKVSCTSAQHSTAGDQNWQTALWRNLTIPRYIYPHAT